MKRVVHVGKRGKWREALRDATDGLAWAKGRLHMNNDHKGAEQLQPHLDRAHAVLGSKLPDVSGDGEQPDQQAGGEHDDGRSLEAINERPQDEAEDADDGRDDCDDGHLATV